MFKTCLSDFGATEGGWEVFAPIWNNTLEPMCSHVDDQGHIIIAVIFDIPPLTVTSIFSLSLRCHTRPNGIETSDERQSREMTTDGYRWLPWEMLAIVGFAGIQIEGKTTIEGIIEVKIA